MGVIGVAPGARLWAVKVCSAEGCCPISNQIKAMDYLMQHASERGVNKPFSVINLLNILRVPTNQRISILQVIRS